MMATWGTYYSFGVFFTPMLDDFKWTRAVTSGAFSTATILEGILCIVVGGITDRRGPRLVLTITGAFLGLGYLLMSQVQTIWQLYLFYGLIMGIGMSGPFNSIVPTIARWFTKYRGLMTGFVVAGIGVGAIVVPPIASYIITFYNWRTSYLVMGCLILLVVVVGAQFLVRDPIQKKQRPYGQLPFVEETQTKTTSSGGLSIWLKSWRFWLFSLAFFCYGFGLFTVMVHVVPYAIDMDVPALSAASIIAVIGIASTIGKVFMGWVADRIGGRWSFAIGFAGMTVSLLWLIGAKELWMFLVFAAVFGFTYSGLVAPQPHLANELFGMQSLGLILGIGSFLFTVGGSVGPVLAGYLFDVSNSYHDALLICTAMTALGLVTTLLLRPRN